jgi:hypothetical protein
MDMIPAARTARSDDNPAQRLLDTLMLDLFGTHVADDAAYADVAAQLHRAIACRLGPRPEWRESALATTLRRPARRLRADGRMCIWRAGAAARHAGAMPGAVRN